MSLKIDMEIAKGKLRENDGENARTTVRADLHTHTTNSDGLNTPSQVVEWAKDRGIEVLAITDHDSVGGLDEGYETAKKLGVSFIGGIEFSTYQNCEIHILGYNFDYKNPAFVQELQKIKQLRIERNIEIGNKLKGFGIDLDLDFSKEGLGRKIIAYEMVKEGYCKDKQEAFEKWLGIYGKAYCPHKRMTPAEAVSLVKKYGGKSSMAHPKRYLLDSRLETFVRTLKDCGLDGIEAKYPTHTEKDVKELVALANKYGLFITGGSDRHDGDEQEFCCGIEKRTIERLFGN